MLAAIVVALWLLDAWVVFASSITVAPFFGDVPSRDEYIDAGLMLTTAILPTAAAVWLALLHGGRWSLALLLAPALLMVPSGLGMLGKEGDDRDPNPGRPLGWSDLFSEFTVLSYGAAAVFAALAIAVVVSRRRARAGRPESLSTL